MASQQETTTVWRFGVFEVDARGGELRRKGLLIRLQEQPTRVLQYLLEHAGDVVTREELQQQLWRSDTFVDFDHGLNTSVMKLREALGDSADTPIYIQTVPRKGYRFIAQVTTVLPVAVGNGSAVVMPDPSLRVPEGGSNKNAVAPAEPVLLSGSRTEESGCPREQRRAVSGWQRDRRFGLYASIAAAVLLTVISAVFYRRMTMHKEPVQRTLTRVTFDEGLQFGATWSPDGRYLAYSSDRGGEFQIWVVQVSGGDPVQVTRGQGPNWEPDWSPDGKYIAFRAEAGKGGIFVVPALGGAGMERKIADFGFLPRWSPDSSQILFESTRTVYFPRFFVVDLDGGALREVQPPQIEPGFDSVSAAWHPDGKRISIWTTDDTNMKLTFWNVPVTGGPGLKTEATPEMTRQLGEQWRGGRIKRWLADYKFAWMPSGRAIYLEHTSRDTRTIWRMTVDPRTLRARSLERMTSGPGVDANFALSRDGTRMAFTEQNHQVRTWLFPFDASHGRITGMGVPVTSPGLESWLPNLSPDGSKLVFMGDRAGTLGLWEESLPGGNERPVIVDKFARGGAVWSPDGKRLAYLRGTSSVNEQFVIWSSDSRTEEAITPDTAVAHSCWVYDWAKDGKWLLVTAPATDTPAVCSRNLFERASNVGSLVQIPTSPAPVGMTQKRILASNPRYDIFQGHFSPDSRWVAFEGVRDPGGVRESVIFTIPAGGGKWVALTDGKEWADKPRWSPDGKTLFYISGKGGFFNVWGRKFDASTGKPLGEPFQITSWNSAKLMIPENIPMVEMSVTQSRLAITAAQISGSIWVMDNADR